ncbi:MAG TPA: NADP-dependent oxidoreductase [Caulobacteraceae bacterium]|jgi:NADPH:quinone reductase-like Zn-dependent oxidoreductase
MQSLRFLTYGEPADVLRLEDAEAPTPKPGHIRVKVHACGLNPADWALCRGLFAQDLPRGVGLDVSGIVDAVGESVTDVTVGDRVLGAAEFRAYPTAGASDYAILHAWGIAPEGLDLVDAAALPMAIETGYRCIDLLGVTGGQTVLIYGAGSVIGFAAVQMALLRGARVIAAAGPSLAPKLHDLGAEVTAYGDGMGERVRGLAGGAPDLIFDGGPPSDALPALVEIAGGDGARVLTVGNHGPKAEALGVRNSWAPPRNDMLGAFAALAAEGKFYIPIARTYPLTEWRDAVVASLSGHAHGKLVLLPGA